MPRRPLTALLLAAAALAAAAALVPGAAGAAKHRAASGKPHARVVLRPGCYLSGETGLLRGFGFKPNGTWTAKLSGTKQIGTGRIDAHGRVRARFTAPRYHGKNGTRELTLSLTDGPHVASTTFLMTPLNASFSPTTGDPKTLRVRWRVLGLGRRHGVYVHYVAPNGTLKRTLRIGTTRGPCGALKTGPIALFPFKFSYGTWTFQIDASRHYSRATLPRLLIGFEIRRPSRSGRRPSGGQTGGIGD
jgi:hypothetical protein